MSILVKGMDMPKNCCDCPCGRVDSATKDPMNNEIFNMYCMVQHEYWTCYRKVSGKPSWCPLVPVPTPHGRLIDEDTFVQTIRQGYCLKCRAEKRDYKGLACRACQWDDAIGQIDCTETVIEAEE